jgi:nucleotide-binding universal stress UspA family protein
MELQTRATTSTEGSPEAVLRRRVVVGTDDSSGARAAVAYAFTAAARRHAALDLVLAYPVVLPWAWDTVLDVDDVEPLRAALSRTAEDHRSELQQQAPAVADVPVQVLVGRGSAADVLVDASDTADQLVVGSRGRGGVRSALLGSVALHCVTAARCPVVVVHEWAAGGSAPPPSAPGDQAPRVVVGVDGSAASTAALAAALDEAAAMGAVVDVVVAFSLADLWIDGQGGMAADPGEIRMRVQDRVASMVDAARAGLPADLRSEPAAVRTDVLEGQPVDTLLERARGAQLLVVGSHGHGVLRALMLGSVALGCVLHAPCPVMVVHAPNPGGVAHGEAVDASPA